MPTAAETKRSENAAAMLRSAIESTNIERVRDVLNTICDHLPQARDLACEKLLVNAAEESEEKMTSYKKRPSRSEYTRQRYEICEQCEKEFDVVENDEEEDSCEWHDGEVEVDYEADAWIDHEVGDHGPYDTEQNRKDRPEGFMWSCCEETPGETEGCETGPHKALEGKMRKKRKRV